MYVFKIFKTEVVQVCLPFLASQASHLALPFRSNRPGRPTQNSSYTREEGERERREYEREGFYLVKK